jgi:hypothetical protein
MKPPLTPLIGYTRPTFSGHGSRWPPAAAGNVKSSRVRSRKRVRHADDQPRPGVMGRRLRVLDMR